jgi:hypothetical protein
VHRAEVEELQKIIGKQAIQIKILRKRGSCLGKSRGSQGPEASRSSILLGIRVFHASSHREPGDPANHGTV